jgi:tetratricopeptide (TPR) repeat protein
MRALAALALCLSLAGTGFGQPATDGILLARIAKHLREGDYNNAERGFREALEAPGKSESASPDRQSQLIDLRNGLGDLLREEGKEREARDLFNQVLSSPDITWKQRLSATMGLAEIDAHSISLQAGEKQWMTSLAMAREHSDNTGEAAALRGLANMWFEANSPAKAEPLLRRSLKILENDPASPAWQTASTLATTGLVYSALDKLALAEKAWTRALDLNRKTFGETHPQVAYVMERLAEVYARRKHFAVARQYSDRALDIMRGACGEGSMAVAAAYASRGNVEEYARSFPAAVENYATALGIVRANPDNPVARGTILRNYAALLKATHKDREAHALVLEANSLRTTRPEIAQSGQ